MNVPSNKPPPSEYAVIVVSSSILFIVVGAVARAFWCLGIGIVIAVGYWLYRRLKDD